MDNVFRPHEYPDCSDHSPLPSPKAAVGTAEKSPQRAKSQRAQDVLRTKTAKNGSNLKPAESVRSNRSSVSNATNGSRKRPRFVRFSQWESVHPVACIEDYTQREFDAVWYTRREYDDIFDHCELTADVLEEHGFVRGHELCSCGLEHWTVAGTKKRERNRAIAFETVMNEQDKQWQEGVDDHDLLGSMYAKVTSHSRRAAMTLALQLEREVQCFFTPDERRILLSDNPFPLFQKHEKKKRSKSKERSRSRSRSSGRKSSKKKKKKSSSDDNGKVKRASSERNIGVSQHQQQHLETIDGGYGISSSSPVGRQEPLKTAALNTLLSSPVSPDTRKPRSMSDLRNISRRNSGVSSSNSSSACNSERDGSYSSSYGSVASFAEFVLPLPSTPTRTPRNEYDIADSTRPQQDYIEDIDGSSSDDDDDDGHRSRNDARSQKRELSQSTITLKEIRNYAETIRKSSTSSTDRTATTATNTSRSLLDDGDDEDGVADIDEDDMEDYHDSSTSNDYDIPLHSLSGSIEDDIDDDISIDDDDDDDIVVIDDDDDSSNFGSLSEHDDIDVNVLSQAPIRTTIDGSTSESLTSRLQKVDQSTSPNKGSGNNSVASGAGRSVQSRGSRVGIGSGRRVPGRPGTMISPTGQPVKRLRAKKNDFTPSLELIQALAATAKPKEPSVKPPPPPPPLIPGGLSRKIKYMPYGSDRNNGSNATSGQRNRVRIIDPPAHSLCISPSQQKRDVSKLITSSPIASDDTIESMSMASTLKSAETFRNQPSSKSANNNRGRAAVTTQRAKVVRSASSQDISSPSAADNKPRSVQRCMSASSALERNRFDEERKNNRNSGVGSEPQFAATEPEHDQIASSAVPSDDKENNSNDVSLDSFVEDTKRRFQEDNGKVSSGASKGDPDAQASLASASMHSDEIVRMQATASDTDKVLKKLEVQNARYMMKTTSGSSDIDPHSTSSRSSSTSSSFEVEQMIAEYNETKRQMKELGQSGPAIRSSLSTIDESAQRAECGGEKLVTTARIPKTGSSADKKATDSTSAKQDIGGTDSEDMHEKPASMPSLGSTSSTSKTKKKDKKSSKKKKSSSRDPKKPKSSRSLRKSKKDVTATSFSSLPDLANVDDADEDRKLLRRKKKTSSSSSRDLSDKKSKLKKSKSFQGDFSAAADNSSDVKKPSSKRKLLRATKSFQSQPMSSSPEVAEFCSSTAITDGEKLGATAEQKSDNVTSSSDESPHTSDNRSSDKSKKRSDKTTKKKKTKRVDKAGIDPVKPLSSSSASSASSSQKNAGSRQLRYASSEELLQLKSDGPISNNSVTSHTTDTTYSSGDNNNNNNSSSSSSSNKNSSNNVSATTTRDGKNNERRSKSKKPKSSKKLSADDGDGAGSSSDKKKRKKPKSVRKLSSGKPLSFLSVCNE